MLMHLYGAKINQMISGKMLQANYDLKIGDLESFKFPLNSGGSIVFLDPRAVHQINVVLSSTPACQV